MVGREGDDCRGLFISWGSGCSIVMACSISSEGAGLGKVASLFNGIDKSVLRSLLISGNGFCILESDMKGEHALRKRLLRNVHLPEPSMRTVY